MDSGNVHLCYRTSYPDSRPVEYFVGLHLSAHEEADFLLRAIEDQIRKTPSASPMHRRAVIWMNALRKAKDDGRAKWNWPMKIEGNEA